MFVSYVFPSIPVFEFCYIFCFSGFWSVVFFTIKGELYVKPTCLESAFGSKFLQTTTKKSPQTQCEFNSVKRLWFSRFTQKWEFFVLILHSYIILCLHSKTQQRLLQTNVAKDKHLQLYLSYFCCYLHFALHSFWLFDNVIMQRHRNELILPIMQKHARKSVESAQIWFMKVKFKQFAAT